MPAFLIFLCEEVEEKCLWCKQAEQESKFPLNGALSEVKENQRPDFVVLEPFSPELFWDPEG